MAEQRTATSGIRRTPVQVAGLLSALAFASLAFAQTSASSSAPLNARLKSDSPVAASFSQTIAPIPKGVLYMDGELSIDTIGMTLWDVLSKIQVLTGIKIDIPIEANGERIPMIKLGPGPAREILASLLRETHFNFLIVASEADPDRLQSVLIMPMDAKDGTSPAKDTAPTSPTRRPYGATPDQVAVSSEPKRINETPSHSAETGSSGASTSAESDPSSAASVPSSDGSIAAVPLSSANAEMAARAPTLSPPPVLNQQSINQQLQQMYQQRMGMIQQGRSAASSGTSGN